MKRILSAILLLCLVGIVAPVSAKADKNEVICKWIHLSLIFLYLVFYLINIALMGFGVIPDANGFDMYNDLFFF